MDRCWALRQELYEVLFLVLSRRSAVTSGSHIAERTMCRHTLIPKSLQSTGEGDTFTRMYICHLCIATSCSAPLTLVPNEAYNLIYLSKLIQFIRKDNKLCLLLWWEETSTHTGRIGKLSTCAVHIYNHIPWPDNIYITARKYLLVFTKHGNW